MHIQKKVGGFKISLDQLENYPMVSDFLRKESTIIVYLSSEDKLRLSLSLIKARAINFYHSAKETSISRMTFDPAKVVELIGMDDQSRNRCF